MSAAERVAAEAQYVASGQAARDVAYFASGQAAAEARLARFLQRQRGSSGRCPRRTRARARGAGRPAGRRAARRESGSDDDGGEDPHASDALGALAGAGRVAA
jgi:hypothetical protein